MAVSFRGRCTTQEQPDQVASRDSALVATRAWRTASPTRRYAGASRGAAVAGFCPSTRRGRLTSEPASRRTLR